VLRTAICDLFGIEYPIIQGGMAHVGTAELVSAVSEAGGLGIIGAGYYQPDWLRQQIALTRERTGKPFGVNLPLTSPYADDVIGVIIEEQVQIVTTGVGDPGNFMAAFSALGVSVMPVVGSVSLARRLEAAGVSALVAEGAESGGHIGDTTTMPLVPQVVDAVGVPVVAAGGIADGRGLAAALALGAQGIQMGTRFVCSEECIAHADYKQKILEAHDRSTVVTGRSTGLPVRSLKNSLTVQYLALEEGGATPEVLGELGQGRMHQGLVDGDVDEGSLLAGQISGIIHEIKPVKVIIEEVMAGAEEVISRLGMLQRGG
jgi:enoyl-[acyl-carrier protein] reductase II